MAETPEELFARASEALRSPGVEEWETWPFTGPVTPRALAPPLDHEPARGGEGGVGCTTCTASDSAYLWTNDRWRLRPIGTPNGLPIVLLLDSRTHYAEPGDLPDDMAGELGMLQVRIDRAIRTIDGIGRVHICRWGDGGEHLHWWFLARPARLPQLLGSFAAIWDDVLPPTPQAVWDENLQTFLAAFDSSGG